MLPPKDRLTICFAHAAYQMKATFDALDTGVTNFELRDRDALDQRIGEADVLVVSGLWHNGLIALGGKLRFVQSIGSGTDQFDKAALAARGIRLASAAGVNARAVAEHAMAMILALARRLPEARDNQAARVWRGMISDLTQREDELGGKTLLIWEVGSVLVCAGWGGSAGGWRSLRRRSTCGWWGSGAIPRRGRARQIRCMRWGHCQRTCRGRILWR